MIKKLILIGVTAFALSGCQTTLTKEFRHSGGYAGYLLDKRTFDGSESKDIQLFRMTMLLAMAARLGAEEIDNGEDADAFLKYLETAVTEVNYAAANTRDIDDTNIVCGVGLEKDDSKTCSGYYSNFESDLPLVEKRMFSLVLNALPDENAADFVEDALSGDILGAAFNALQAGLDTVEGIHQVASIYRSAQEVVAAELSKGNEYKCVDTNEGQKRPFNTKTDSTSDAVKCLGLEGQIFDKSPNEVKGEDLNFPFEDSSFDSMMQIVQASCASLPIQTVSTERMSTLVRQRNTLCSSLEFDPKARPTEIDN